MKTKQKINVALGFILLFALFTFSTFLFPKQTSALSVNEAQYCTNHLNFTDIAHIVCKTDSFSNNQIVFTDVNPTDGQKGYHSDIESKSITCQGKDSQIDMDAYNHSGNFTLKDSGKTLYAQIALWVNNPRDSGCAYYNPQPNKFRVSQTANIAKLLKGGSNQASSLKSLNNGTLSSRSFSRLNSGGFDPSNGAALFEENLDLTKCSGSILATNFIADNKEKTSGHATYGWVYEISSGGNPFSSYSSGNLANVDNPNNCGVSKFNFGIGNGGTALSFNGQITGIKKSLNGQTCDPTQNPPGGYSCKCTVDAGHTDCRYAPSSGTTGGGDNSGNADTSACVFKTNSSGWDSALSWILCPVVNGLSKSADAINVFVEKQLNFDVHANLSDSVKKAWTIFRSLASVIIVIVMLIMVISQAVGGGPFEAYTIRKMLPRLAVAVIVMQISWYLCIWLISLANDAGQGIAGLIAAPFGGTGNLDLASLLHRLSPFWAASIGIGTTAGVITAMVFAGPILAFGWPVLLLAILLVIIAVVVAVATLLFRNAFLILLVMLSPLAFIAYVLPGTERYWKMWKDNFVKLLIFFPLVMAMIYGGRVFAWTAGNLGNAGPLDVIMVIAGFFGPYFFLPKSFKWGGNLLATVSDGLNKSWPVRKSRETATQGLMGRQQRKLNEYARELNPEKDGYARRIDGRKFGVLPVNWSGSLAKTALWNARAGRVVPTKRALASALQRGEQWNEEENAIVAARIKQKQRHAAGEGHIEQERPPYSYTMDEDGNVKAEVSDNPTTRGKAAIFEDIGSDDSRKAGMAVDRALRTSSFVEMGKNLVPVENDDLKAKIKASGAEYFEGDKNNPATRGKLFVRMYDLPAYNSKLNNSEELYPLPMGKFLVATPHITNPEGKDMGTRIAKLQSAENSVAETEGRAARTFVPVLNPAGESLDMLQDKEYKDAKSEKRAPKVFVRPHHLQRAINTIDGYLDAGNITSQSEAEFGEFARLAKQDPDIAIHFGALLDRIASGGQGGINVLTQLNSSASMQGTIEKLLKQGGNRVASDKIEGYLSRGKAAIASQPTTSSPRAEPGSGEGGNGGGQAGTTAARPQRPGGGGGGGFRPSGSSTARGNVSLGAPGAQYSSPPPAGELRIDHEALAETIREASRQGTKLGLNQAIKDTGIHRPGTVFKPDDKEDKDES